MLNINKNFIAGILNLNRTAKQVIVLSLDILLSILALYLAFVIRLESFTLDVNYNLYILISFTVFFIPFFISLGLYKAIFRYSGFNSIINILFATSIYGFIFFILVIFSKMPAIPRSIGVLQPILFFIFVSFSRVLIVSFIRSVNQSKSINNILLYGAGYTGSFALNYLKDYNVLGFLEDDPKKVNHKINGYRIFNSIDSEKIIISKKITQIIITIPTLTVYQRRKIISKLGNFNIEIIFFPSASEIINRKLQLKDFERVNISDLIDRKISWNVDLINDFLIDKSILITGAGGSIGTELVIQSLNAKPKLIVCIDNNEYNLYKLQNKLDKIKTNKISKIKFHYLLCSINNKNLIEYYFSLFKPDIVFHAAAYKHVPLAEYNVTEYLNNNVIGTQNIIKASLKYKVQNFLFISTDKAVRPTNIMGASKRLSELMLLSYAKTKETHVKTIISMVRFGNVLGSVGSVVPLFNDQLSNGGPLTVTHPEVTRYFMSINEAVGLVLNSMIISKGGEVFILDMGEPVKIINLAKKMIKLFGFNQNNNYHNKKKIEIVFTGLRPGEKLYEELLIGTNPIKTNHKDIFMEKESIIDTVNLKLIIEEVEKNINSNQTKKLIEILEKNINGFEYKS